MWLLEKEIKHPENDMKIRHALNALGVEYVEIDKRPFERLDANTLDDREFDFVYGSTNLIEDLMGEVSGIYFNEDNFNYKTWSDHYGNHLFNDPKESQIMTIGNAHDETMEENKLYFMRPVKDLKSFSGTVVNKKEFMTFIEEVKSGSYTALNNDVEIVIAPAYKIEKEWRCFMVDGEVATASQYRNNGNLEITRGNIPEEMKEFAKSMSQIWSPEKVFTLDVGLSKNTFYIIEAQCANTSGFYDCDIEALVNYINKVPKNEKRSGHIPRF